MIVACSQCGAKIDIEDGRRFITCPFCRSSLLVEKDRTFECFFLEHKRNDIWAKVFLLSQLKDAGIDDEPKDLAIEFSYFPIWHITHSDGVSFTQPAAHTTHTEISSFRIPAGDLIYYDREKDDLGETAEPTIPPEAATHWTKGDRDSLNGLVRLWLIYLPIYFFSFTIDGVRHKASIIGDAARVYSDAVKEFSREKRNYRPLVFFIITFLVCLILGFVFSGSLLMQISVIVGAMIVFLLSSPLVLRNN
ncbi:MAG: hypothetical protein JW885_16215 [Deltaproteobacteria bacterium]|nr:hypothetical protein [Candidatus Zymogenaceae bacterium]